MMRKSCLLNVMKKNNNVVLVFLTTIATLAISSTAAAIHNGTTDHVLCKETERQALLRFKKDLKDPMNRLSSWVGIEGADCCSWTGVACDNLTGHVRELRLGYPIPIVEGVMRDERYELGGKINPSLLDLNYLNYLDLSGNDFEGIPIPSFIGSLKSLIHLDLSHAEFGGLFPHQLGNLSNLRYLNLKNSYGLEVEKLQWISGLTLLQFLDMSGVDMSKAYDWAQVLNTLPSLGELRLSRCDLGNISPHLPVINFTSLSIFDVSGNDHFALLPNWLFSLKNLNFLYLSGISLGGSFPLGLTNMTNHLKFLDLSANGLNSTIPQWLGGFNRLEILDLRLNELQGNIPASIGNLTSMVSLNLSNNQLTGKIPNSFGNLFRLRELQLSHNQLTGQLTNQLGKSRNLISLFLFSNSLSGSIPTAIGKLSKLRDFDISNNQLNGSLPMNIGELSNLIHFDASDNELNGNLPESFGQLVNLETLGIYNNQLNGNLPESLGQLVNLETLDISYNQLNGNLPESFGQLVNLETLDISNNQLNGNLPESFGQLVNLETLYISNNQLNGNLPESFGQLVNLETLDISNNSLEGLVSEVHFSNLTSLKYLYASGNSLVLKTSPNWAPPFQLETLMLNSWHLGPKLPLWLRRQQHLLELQISNTGISDTIPTWFCNISSQLSQLNLSHNQFHGPFPCHISPSGYSSLEIDISSNQFNGSLPLVSSTEIGFLDFSNNSFSGSVTHFFCDNSSSSGRFILLGNNLLSGAIPKCWKKWEDLAFLNLDNNNLVGIIPSSIGDLTSLLLLNLRNNNLSGELPLSLRNSTAMQILDLSGNKLIGKIPEWIGMSLSSLVVLNLRSNNFQGDIPLQLCNLAWLQVLDLAHNNLSGTIPTCFYNLTAMKTSKNSRFDQWIYPDTMAEAELVTKGRKVEYGTLLRYVKSIDLSENNLVGEIPEELIKLDLQTLNLSRNHLVGKIPSKIGDMRWLESLDLSQNQLYGEIPASISGLSFLSYLNLSCNNFTGRIPTGTQLQSFKESSYVGNHLCGPPLRQNCSTSDQSIPIAGVKQESLLSESNLYLSLGLGFAFGFWAILGSLLVNMPWSVAFSRVVDRIVLKLYAFIIEFF